ncbi:MAG: winged helix-turn-helix domain-containing protein [Candidatus Nanohalobium sp.]
MEESNFGEDFQRYNFETYQEAFEKLRSSREHRTDIEKIFKSLKEREKTPEELSDELNRPESSVRSAASKLKKDGLVYSVGPAKGKYYGLSVEELHDGDYIQGIN